MPKPKKKHPATDDILKDDDRNRFGHVRAHAGPPDIAPTEPSPTERADDR